MDFTVLRNYAKLMMELKSIRQEINTLYKPVGSPKLTNDGAKNYSLPSSPTERALRMIERLRAQEERKLAEIEAQLQEVNDWIDKIDDPEVRAIVRYHYLQGLSWNATSKAMYGIDAGDAVRKKFNRFKKAHNN